MFNEGIKYIILHLFPVPTFKQVTVPAPLVKKLRFQRFRFRFHNNAKNTDLCGFCYASQNGVLSGRPCCSAGRRRGARRCASARARAGRTPWWNPAQVQSQLCDIRVYIKLTQHLRHISDLERRDAPRCACARARAGRTPWWNPAQVQSQLWDIRLYN